MPTTESELPTLTPAAKPIKPRRKRCTNCAELFELKKPWQKFCSYSCQRQFHHYGNSYGKLKETVKKLIEQQVREIAPTKIKDLLALELATITEAAEKRFDKIEDDLKRRGRAHDRDAEQMSARISSLETSRLP